MRVEPITALDDEPTEVIASPENDSGSAFRVVQSVVLVHSADVIGGFGVLVPYMGKDVMRECC